MAAQQKRKLSGWWFLCIAMLLAMIFFGQLWGPSPPIRVAPETTRATDLLSPDGFPDYAAHLHRQLDREVPAAENAAVPIWQALWPGELNAEGEKLICEALGMPTPNPDEALASLFNTQNMDSVAQWSRSLGPTESRDEFDVVSELQERADEVISSCMKRPWTTEMVPPLGQWALDNQGPLDLLVEGASRPRFYSPSPSLLDDKDEPLVMMLLPGAQMLRRAARALSCRAMWHVGEGRNMEAWQDLQAIHRIARHGAKGNWLIRLLVAIAVDSVAFDGTQALLHHGNLTEEEAETILRDRNQMPPMPAMAQPLTTSERYAYLDIVRRASNDSLDSADLQAILGLSNFRIPFDIIRSTRIDWNHVAERGNHIYDQMFDAMELPRSERIIRMEQIERDLADSSTGLEDPALFAKSLISCRVRSDVMANLVISMTVPAMSAASEATDRVSARLNLARTSAGLALFRARHGNYPETLSELQPDIFAELPVDCFSGQPMIYRRKGDGYLLYSVYRNELDDGGTNFGGDIVKGEWAETGRVDLDTCDLVVLMPLPPTLPTIKTTVVEEAPPNSPDQ